jgi:hypothetical protein
VENPQCGGLFGPTVDFAASSATNILLPSYFKKIGFTEPFWTIPAISTWLAFGLQITLCRPKRFAALKIRSSSPFGVTSRVPRIGDSSL